MEELLSVRTGASPRSRQTLLLGPWRLYLSPLLVGLAIRLCYALLAKQPSIPTGADQYYYRGQAELITHGYWWDLPGSVSTGTPGLPGIAHPPLFSAVLAVADILDLHSADAQRAFLCVLGVSAVIFCGRIGARLQARSGEVVIAWVAVLLPGMWIYNGEVLSETVTVPLVASTVLAFFRIREKPTGKRALVLGLLVALCALTRPELLILAFILLPLWIPTPTRTPRVIMTAAFLVGVVVLAGPWVGRNLHDFRDTEVMSANFGSVIVGANCAPTYSGPLLGAWDAKCATGLRPPVGDASIVDNYYRHVGEHYAHQHLTRIPVVALARLGRAVGVWPVPAQAVTWNAIAAGVWPRWASWLYLVTWLVSIPFVVIGVFSLRRGGVVAWPLYGLIVLYLVVSVALYADPRFASSCQPALAVLMGIGLASTFSAVPGRSGLHVSQPSNGTPALLSDKGPQ
jgi:4-amino-4-deoxy-L-arabinose transferase-like glycosyltransferase